MSTTEYHHSSNIRFYRNQLNKFKELGMGQKTENGVLITQQLINTTKKRLSMLNSLSLKSIRRSKE